MKYFLVEARTLDGEHEYHSKCTIQRNTKPTNKQMDKFCEEYFGYGDYTETELYDIQELSKEEYDIFKKYHV